MGNRDNSLTLSTRFTFDDIYTVDVFGRVPAHQLIRLNVTDRERDSIYVYIYNLYH